MFKVKGTTEERQMFEAIAIIAVASIKAIITIAAGKIALNMTRNHRRASTTGRRGH